MISETVKFNGKNIDFVPIEGKDNLYYISEDTFLDWYSQFPIDNRCIFATKNPQGDFVGYDDKYNGELLTCFLKYTGAYKDLKPAGYCYTRSSNGASYIKEVDRCTYISVIKAGNIVLVKGLTHQSGFLLNWLIDHNFNVPLNRHYFICNSTGQIRLRTEDMLPCGLKSEESLYIQENIVIELKRLFDRGDISASEKHSTQ
jgi:hypothetical protein